MFLILQMNCSDSSDELSDYADDCADSSDVFDASDHLSDSSDVC